MEPKPNTTEQFIQIRNKMINIRIVKQVELNGTSLGVTIPDGEEDLTIYLHEDGDKVFEAMKRYCLNYDVSPA